MTSDAPRLSRLHVVINAETAAILAEMTDREQVTVPEAVRRLIGYGAVTYRAAVGGRQVVLRGGGHDEERVVLLDPPRLARDQT
ncbi:MAG: hypothetical protein ACRDSN_12370 [Pseudonocardiaceae bacterium]